MSGIPKYHSKVTFLRYDYELSDEELSEHKKDDNKLELKEREALDIGVQTDHPPQSRNSFLMKRLVILQEMEDSFDQQYPNMYVLSLSFPNMISFIQGPSS